MSESNQSNELLLRQGLINPRITQDFVTAIEKRAEQGAYKAEVTVGDRSIPIDVYPKVFPPRSDYSVSSRSVYETFGKLDGLQVADIGCGSGIESIVAAMAGAKQVDATDINEAAVECARHNAALNEVGDKIAIYHGDLLSALPKQKYDLIIANLPIVDFQPERPTGVTAALYDPGLQLHRRLLSEAKGYLAPDGVITFTHANLQSGKTDTPERDFQVLEQLIAESGYEIVERTAREDLGYRWVNYKIKLKVSIS